MSAPLSQRALALLHREANESGTVCLRLPEMGGTDEPADFGALDDLADAGLVRKAATSTVRRQVVQVLYKLTPAGEAAKSSTGSPALPHVVVGPFADEEAARRFLRAVTGFASGYAEDLDLDFSLDVRDLAVKP